jgi:hypothetical protein
MKVETLTELAQTITTLLRSGQLPKEDTEAEQLLSCVKECFSNQKKGFDRAMSIFEPKSKRFKSSNWALKRNEMWGAIIPLKEEWSHYTAIEAAKKASHADAKKMVVSNVIDLNQAEDIYGEAYVHMHPHYFKSIAV